VLLLPQLINDARGGGTLQLQETTLPDGTIGVSFSAVGELGGVDVPLQVPPLGFPISPPVTYTFVSDVPEPASLTLVGTVVVIFAGVGILRRRRAFCLKKSIP
jgi:hypothetical protein